MLKTGSHARVRKARETHIAEMDTATVINTTQLIFLDSAPVIYYVEAHPVYQPRVRPIFDAIDAGLIRAVTSPVTLAECLIVPLRQNDADLERRFTQTLTSANHTQLQPITREVGRSAAELRAGYGLKMMDALQVAAAFLSGCDAFLTNDRDLLRITEIQVILIDDLT